MLLSASSIPPVPHFLLIFADLGHYNLFDRGIRDISSGNVLCYSEPIGPPPLEN